MNLPFCARLLAIQYYTHIYNMSIVVGLIKIVGDTLRDRYSIITLNDRSLTLPDQSI